MKTVDDLLIGTPYEGAETTQGPHYGALHNTPQMLLWENAKRNAALASLLPAAVKALEEVDKMMREIVGRHAHRENNALVIEGFTGCKADDASKLIQATLRRISEATKAVGE